MNEFSDPLDTLQQATEYQEGIAEIVGFIAHSLFLHELRPQSTLVMDNAPFHRKEVLHSFAREHARSVLFLSPYSPEVNTMEHDFAAVKKKRWAYAPTDTSLDNIVAISQPRSLSHVY